MTRSAERLQVVRIQGGAAVDKLDDVIDLQLGPRSAAAAQATAETVSAKDDMPGRIPKEPPVKGPCAGVRAVRFSVGPGRYAAFDATTCLSGGPSRLPPFGEPPSGVPEETISVDHRSRPWRGSKIPSRRISSGRSTGQRGEVARLLGTGPSARGDSKTSSEPHCWLSIPWPPATVVRHRAPHPAGGDSRGGADRSRGSWQGDRDPRSRGAPPAVTWKRPVGPDDNQPS